MPDDTVTLLPSTIDALDRLGLGDFSRVETPERMAWVACILRDLDDTPETFPHGKWATIQSIENQVCAAARARAFEITSALLLATAERETDKAAHP
jgi:hypothetical protein